MSKPTLYRIDTMAIAGLSYEDAMLIRSVLVPVEPCEHGDYDGHYAGEYIDYSHGDQRRYTIWCPGAGIGGDDE